MAGQEDEIFDEFLVNFWLFSKGSKMVKVQGPMKTRHLASLLAYNYPFVSPPLIHLATSSYLLTPGKLNPVSKT
mgnify:CR=1 FL=1